MFVIAQRLGEDAWRYEHGDKGPELHSTLCFCSQTCGGSGSSVRTQIPPRCPHVSASQLSHSEPGLSVRRSGRWKWKSITSPPFTPVCVCVQFFYNNFICVWSWMYSLYFQRMSLFTAQNEKCPAFSIATCFYDVENCLVNPRLVPKGVQEKSQRPSVSECCSKLVFSAGRTLHLRCMICLSYVPLGAKRMSSVVRGFPSLYEIIKPVWKLDMKRVFQMNL